MPQLPTDGAIPDAAEVEEPELVVPVESAPTAVFVDVLDEDDVAVDAVFVVELVAVVPLLVPVDVAPAPTPVEMVVVSCEAAVGFVAATVMPSAAVESAEV